MEEEIQALHHNHTWTLVPKISNMNVIGCRWIYKVKQKPDGTIDRYKARLVAKGYKQEEGFETFSPVIKITTVRLLLSLTVTKNWYIHQMDVSNAFLHGNLIETIFMSQPLGFQDKIFPSYVCQIHISLYGLKQAPREWFKHLSSFLHSLNFQGSSTDTSLFFHYHNNTPIFILIYVDDILLISPSFAVITPLIQTLKNTFTMKDVGPAHYFLGIEFL